LAEPGSPRSARFLLAIGAAAALLAPPAPAGDSLVPYRIQIEQGYDARDNRAIEAAIAALKSAGKATGQQDLATYYTAFARLRQSAVPGIAKHRARDYLELCIGELDPLIKRRPDYARAHALYASCLGASASHYVLRAATRGIASGREMAAAVRLAPDDPWVVLQDGVSDSLTPALFGGNRERALGKLKRADQLFVASRPPGSAEPVFGEGETWLYIGRVYLAMGQKDKAREAWEKARLRAPESADVRDELAKP